MAQRFSDRQLDAAGQVIKRLAAEKAAQRRQDEQKLNAAREKALENAYYREKRSGR